MVVFGGILGYQLTAGALAWIGFNETGIIVLALGLFVAVVFGIAFLLLGMPTVLAIVGTAIAGAGATVAGLAVGLGLLPVAQLGAGVFGGIANQLMAPSASGVCRRSVTRSKSHPSRM